VAAAKFTVESVALPPGTYPSAAAYLTAVENEVIRELNRIRLDPQEVAGRLKSDRTPYFRGNDFHPPAGRALRTREGIHAVNDAIATLSVARPVGALLPSAGMSLACHESVSQASSTGSTDSDAVRRLTSHGTPNGHCMELIGFGDTGGQEMVWRLMICDGDPKRAQRNVILNGKWKHVGVAVGEHKSSYKRMLSITLCEDFVDNATTRGAIDG